MSCFEQSLTLRQQLVAQAPGNGRYRRGMAVVLMKLGALTPADPTRGVAYITRGVATLKALSDESPDNVQARRSYAVSLHALGSAQSEAGNDAGALVTREQALTIREQIAAADPKDEQAQFDLGAVCSDMAESLTNLGQPEEALDYALRSVIIHDKLMSADPGSIGYMHDDRVAYEQVGNAHAALAARGSPDESARVAHWNDARSAYLRAVQLYAGMNVKGAVRAADAGVPAALQAKIAACEAGIAQSGK